MGSRLDLHAELLTFHPNVYFQPPSGFTMTYPCIVYNRTGMDAKHADDTTYMSTQEYQLMVIEKDPDSLVPKAILHHFKKCRITQQYAVNNLHHTTFTLYY